MDIGEGIEMNQFTKGDKVYAMTRITQLDTYLDVLCEISSDVLICAVMKELQGQLELDAEAKKMGNIKYNVKKAVPYEFVTEKRLQSMLTLGMLDLRGKSDWNYVFAKYNGKIISNRISEPGGMAQDTVHIGTRTVELLSKAFSKGNETVISVDGKNFSVDRQGLNIVVIDCKGGSLLDAVAFDTTTEKCQCYRHSGLFYYIYGYSLDSRNFLNWISYAQKWVFQDFSVEKTKSLLKDITDIVSYLNMLLLIKNRYMIILAVKDTPGSYMSDEILNLIARIGFDKFNRELWRMYTGIVAEGKVLYNESANKAGVPTYCDCINKNQTVKIHVSSCPYRDGNEAKIYIGQENYAVNKRGVNIVVVNPATGEVLDSVAFDTHTKDYRFYR